jgi:hypothetical protein
MWRMSRKMVDVGGKMRKNEFSYDWGQVGEGKVAEFAVEVEREKVILDGVEEMWLSDVKSATCGAAEQEMLRNA